MPEFAEKFYAQVLVANGAYETTPTFNTYPEAVTAASNTEGAQEFTINKVFQLILEEGQ